MIIGVNTNTYSYNHSGKVTTTQENEDQFTIW